MAEFAIDPRRVALDWGESEVSSDVDLLTASLALCRPRTLAPRRAAAQASDAELINLLDLFGKQIGERVEADLRLSLLEKVVLELRHTLAELLMHQVVQAPISSLGTADAMLRHPITAVVQPAEDHFIATFFDANINASGDTEVEAVENLKETIVASFRRFRELGTDRLGPGPLKQFEVLREIVRFGGCETDDHKTARD